MLFRLVFLFHDVFPGKGVLCLDVIAMHRKEVSGGIYVIFAICLQRQCIYVLILYLSPLKVYGLIFQNLVFPFI